MFNFFLLILILQIFAGIIIDTFSNLREKQENVVEDMTNTCFICGMRRDEIEKLEKRKEAFRYHTEVRL
jgi:Asp-tRNA(Asn)/Glu-tRNA(Gln) amidotransferase C subunit